LIAFVTWFQVFFSHKKSSKRLGTGKHLFSVLAANLPKTRKEKTISDLYAYVDERNAKL